MEACNVACRADRSREHYIAESVSPEDPRNIKCSFGAHVLDLLEPFRSILFACMLWANTRVDHNRDQVSKVFHDLINSSISKNECWQRASWF